MTRPVNDILHQTLILVFNVLNKDTGRFLHCGIFPLEKLEIVGKWPVVHNVILMQSDFINFLLCESTSSLINEFAIGLLSTSWFDSIMQNQSMNICEHQAVKHLPDAHPTSIQCMTHTVWIIFFMNNIINCNQLSWRCLYFNSRRYNFCSLHSYVLVDEKCCDLEVIVKLYILMRKKPSQLLNIFYNKT